MAALHGHAHAHAATSAAAGAASLLISASSSATNRAPTSAASRVVGLLRTRKQSSWTNRALTASRDGERSWARSEVSTEGSGSGNGDAAAAAVTGGSKRPQNSSNLISNLQHVRKLDLGLPTAHTLAASQSEKEKEKRPREADAAIRGTVMAAAATAVAVASMLASEHPALATQLLDQLAAGPADLSTAVGAATADGHQSLHSAASSLSLAFILPPSLESPFWENVGRFIIYFFTVITGGLFSLVKPVYELAKNPVTAILTLLLVGGGFYLTVLTLQAMLALNDAPGTAYDLYLSS